MIGLLLVSLWIVVVRGWDTFLPFGTRTETSGPLNGGEYEKLRRAVAELRRDRRGMEEYAERHREHLFWDMFRLTWQCPAPMVRYPAGIIDGGKWTCNADKLKAPCVIYSFGSEGNYMFEREMSRFGCEIHTFDCFGEYGGNLPPKTTFYKWCVGGKDEVRNGRRFFTIPTIMRVLGHKKVDFIKMDVEGSEWESLPLLQQLPEEARPWQLAVELHQWRDKRDANQVEQTAAFWLMLDQMGFRLVAREDNAPYGCCSEFVWVRPSGMPK